MKKWLLITCGIFAIYLISVVISTNAQAGWKRTKAASRPNIILIVADDLGYGEAGCYGQKIIKTPHIDRLASEGMRFTDFYAASPVCAPSRCGMLTGRHSGNAYIRDNAEVGEWNSYMGQMPLKDSTFTLGNLMKQAGYTTACIGKWGLGGPGSSGMPLKQGFDYFFGYLCQRQAHNYYPDYLWQNEVKKALNNPPLNPHQKFQGNPTDPASYKKYQGNEYSQDLITEEALRFIAENRDTSFFLYLAYTLPHLALQVPERYLAHYQGKLDDKPYSGQSGYLPSQFPHATYAAMIAALDDYTGQIMASLAEAGLDSNTLILFTSDNGATFDVGGADSYFFNSNGKLRAGKGTLYEGGIRVPLIARWPGYIKPGRVSSLICASWDFMPTFAELSGTNLSHDHDGISLLPEILGIKGQKKHDYLYWEYPGRGGAMAVRMGEWKGVWKNVTSEPYRRVELYNLKSDTGEKFNIAKNHPDKVKLIMECMSKRTMSENPEWNFIGKKFLKNITPGKKPN